jgi:amidophosphoribosyltransferase
MGRRGNAIIFASESCALNAIDAEFIRDIEPGEIVIVEKSKQITMDGKDSYEFDIHTIRDNIDPNIKTSLCFFEHIYIARPDSCLDGQFVNEARTDAGRFLAQQAPVSADAVVGVPDSGLGAAYGYSLESGIPLVTGFIKNRYIGRTFISPSHTARERLVKIKLNPVANNIRGKRIVMVEDSIVRGTTFGRVVKLLRECGATEVHLRIAAPPFKNECYFGADIPDREQLIANRFTVEDIRKIIGADTLEYLSYDNLLKTAGNSKCGFCHGCFSGVYPIN